MRHSLATLLLLTVACSQAGSQQPTELPAYPADGWYSRTSTDPKGRESRFEHYYKFNTRAKFEAFLAEKLGSGCKRTRWTIENGRIDLAATCQTPDGDFHGIPVKIIGTWTDRKIDLTTETVFFGVPIRDRQVYQRIGDDAPRGQRFIYPHAPPNPPSP